LQGDLGIPAGAQGLVVFAHGSGSSRHSPRNRYVAEILRDSGLGTLLLDLLTVDEEAVDQYTRHLRFDISLLCHRLVGATDWAKEEPDLQDFPIGYFGASTGAAAAIMAAAHRPEHIKAIVSRGGRPDLAGSSLEHIQASTLLIVGGRDYPVIELNEQAYARMKCEKRLTIVPKATHLFEEPGTLEQVAELAAAWFTEHL
jgi:pimeloyl-ACP methyl ester carboxylesterase